MLKSGGGRPPVQTAMTYSDRQVTAGVLSLVLILQTRGGQRRRRENISIERVFPLYITVVQDISVGGGRGQWRFYDFSKRRVPN